MAPSNTPDDTIKYLVLVIQSSEVFKPDYHKVCRKAGIASANNAQKKFKKIVEDAGFSLVNGVVAHLDGGADIFRDTTTTMPTTPRKARAKKADKPLSKKRKVADIKSEEEDDKKAGVKDEDGATA